MASKKYKRKEVENRIDHADEQLSKLFDMLKIKAIQAGSLKLLVDLEDAHDEAKLVMDSLLSTTCEILNKA